MGNLWSTTSLRSSISQSTVHTSPPIHTSVAFGPISATYTKFPNTYTAVGSSNVILSGCYKLISGPATTLLRGRIRPISNSNHCNTRLGIKPFRNRRAVRLPIKRYANGIQLMMEYRIVLVFVLKPRLVVCIQGHKMDL